MISRSICSFFIMNIYPFILFLIHFSFPKTLLDIILLNFYFLSKKKKSLFFRVEGIKYNVSFQIWVDDTNWKKQNVLAHLVHKTLTNQKKNDINYYIIFLHKFLTYSSLNHQSSDYEALSSKIKKSSPRPEIHSPKAIVFLKKLFSITPGRKELVRASSNLKQFKYH
jgi:hypothetical protein